MFGLAIAGTASASLWSYYNDLGLNLPSVSERAENYNTIADDVYIGSASQNIALEEYLRGSWEVLGATPTPTSSAPIKYVEAPDFFSYSPAVSGDTTITINDLEDIYGNTLTMASFGDIGYGRIDPNGAKVSESFTFSGVTANSDGTYTLTGVKTVLAQYPYTQTSGLVRSHSINAIVRFTNTASFYDNFANKENDEIVDGDWEFTAFPYFTNGTTLPDANGEFATKYYVDTVGAGGFTALNASTTHATEALGTSPETVGVIVSSTKGMYGGADGQGLYQKVNTNEGLTQDSDGIAINFDSTLVTTTGQIGVNATSTPTADKIPIADGSGKLDGWISSVSEKTLTAGETIAGATLPVAVYQNKTDNEYYACDGNDTDKMKYQGFAITDGTDSNPITVQFSGVVSGFTGLSEGEKYYVQDDKTIGTTVGTYEVLVGIAISETELLIQKGSRYASGVLSFNSTDTSITNTGFRPSSIRISAMNGDASYTSVGGWTKAGGNSCVADFNTPSTQGVAYRSGNTGTEMNGIIDTITDTSFRINNTKAGAAANIFIHWEAIGDL